MLFNHSQFKQTIMKAILIDVENQTIKEVEVTKDSKGSNLQSMYKHIQCDCFTTVVYNENNDIFVDDEGLLKLTPLSKFFLYKGYPQPIAGNGLIVGINNDNGESTDTNLSVDEVAQKIVFMNLRQVQLYEALNEM